jgi:hypothetical protein
VGGHIASSHVTGAGENDEVVISGAAVPAPHDETNMASRTRNVRTICSTQSRSQAAEPAG